MSHSHQSRGAGNCQSPKMRNLGGTAVETAMAGSRHLVDPDLHSFLELAQPFELNETTLPQLRSIVWSGAEISNPDLVERREFFVPGPSGAPDVRLLIYRPAAHSGAPLPCIYHIHGGGYISQSADMSEVGNREFVEALGCVIASVDYRLAPETPFPGPIEDCYAGLAWLFAHAEDLGIDKDRIGVMGESAGGGLAAGLALLARDRGEYPFAFQHLYCPMLDDRTAVTEEPNPYAGEFVWTPQANAFGWRSYLGTEPGSEGVSPYAAAARATELSGLPPTFIGISALDLFVDEDIAYASRLIRAGVPTELHVYPGGFHGFNMLQRDAKVSIQANRDRIEALSRALFVS